MSLNHTLLELLHPLRVHDREVMSESAAAWVAVNAAITSPRDGRRNFFWVLVCCCCSGVRVDFEVYAQSGDLDSQ